MERLSTPARSATAIDDPKVGSPHVIQAGARAVLLKPDALALPEGVGQGSGE